MIVGILMGFAFVQPENIHELHSHFKNVVDSYDIVIPPLPGLDLSRVETEWMRLRGSIPEIWKFNNDGREFQVGEAMKARGLSAEYPVVLIPGIISTVRDLRSKQPWLIFAGIGILVHRSGLSPFLPRESMGWF